MITRRQLLRWIASLGVVGAATAAYAFIVEPMWRARITRYDLTPRRWPSGLNLKVAALADFHACHPWMSPERIRSIVETTNSLGADMIVLLGDYVAGHRYVTEYVPSTEWAKELAALRAPLGVHAILGNHEWWEDRSAQRAGAGPTIGHKALEAVGIPVLQNDAVRLVKDGAPFWLVGLGDQLAFLPSRRANPGRRIGVDDLAGSLAKVTDNSPVILLAHEPDIAVRVPDRVSLMLSGHTHGGQVRLFGWSPVVPSRYGNRFAYGHRHEACDVIVSGGLGCSIAPVRFGVPPEIVLVNLGGGNV
ncbi:MAG: metallophosphoesterase [Xanthobacteraceae bacterium]|nr:metallophosphoesterase [Xanthobacteraceae bacterium]